MIVGLWRIYIGAMRKQPCNRSGMVATARCVQRACGLCRHAARLQGRQDIDEASARGKRKRTSANRAIDTCLSLQQPQCSVGMRVFQRKLNRCGPVISGSRLSIHVTARRNQTL